MAENILPEETAGSALLKVQASSKLAFGATTVALVALASGGTAVLVNHASSMAGPAALPGAALLPDSGSRSDLVVVDRAPGTYGAKPAVAKVDPTVKALRAALAHRPTPGKRTLIAPLVRLGGRVTSPVVGNPDAARPALGVPPVLLPEIGVPTVLLPEIGVPTAGLPGVRPPRRPVAPTVTLPKPGKPAKPGRIGPIVVQPAPGAPAPATPAAGAPAAGTPAAGAPAAGAPDAATVQGPPTTTPDRSALPHNGPVATPADRPEVDDQEAREGGGKHRAGNHKAEGKSASRSEDKADSRDKSEDKADSRDNSERAGKSKPARGRHSR